MSLSLSLSLLSFAAAVGIDATLGEEAAPAAVFVPNFRGDLRGDDGGGAVSTDESSLSSIMMISFSVFTIGACTSPPYLFLRGDLRYGGEGDE